MTVLAVGLGPVAPAIGAAYAPAGEHSTAALAAVVRTLADCRAHLDSRDARAAAALLGAGAATRPQELHAVRRLEILERAHGCGGPARVGVLAYSTHHSAPAPAPAAVTASTGLSWTSPGELAVLAVVAVALAALMYGLVRDLGPPRRRR